MNNRLYIVINQDLEMSPGKIGAHCAHAAFDYLYNSMLDANRQDHTISLANFLDMPQSFKEFGDTIVTLRAHEKDLLKWEAEGYTAVRDRGLTEIEPDSITAVCLGIYDKDVGIPKWIQRLRLL